MARSPWSYRAPLNWSSGGTGFLAADSREDLQKAYDAQWANYLQNSRTQYEGIQSQYGKSLDWLMSTGRQIGKGFGRLSDKVTNQLTGVNQADQTAINDRYAMLMSQALNRAGTLGQGSIGADIMRGYGADQSKASSASYADYAKLLAGATKEIGLAGQEWRGANRETMRDQWNRKIGHMDSLEIARPETDAFVQALAGIAANEEAQKQRDFIAGMMFNASSGIQGVGNQPVSGGTPGGIDYWLSKLGGASTYAALANSFLGGGGAAAMMGGGGGGSRGGGAVGGSYPGGGGGSQVQGMGQSSYGGMISDAAGAVAGGMLSGGGGGGYDPFSLNTSGYGWGSQSGGGIFGGAGGSSPYGGGSGGYQGGPSYGNPYGAGGGSTTGGFGGGYSNMYTSGM